MANPDTSKDFADLVDYDALFGELQKRGVTFDDEEKKKFRDMADKQLRGGLGIDATGWLYSLFAFIQNLIGGADFHNIGDSLSAITSTTGEQHRLEMLQLKTMGLHEAMVQAGGKIAQVADLVTGQSTSSLPPELMDHGIYKDIRETINLPWGTTSSLDHNNIGAQFKKLNPSLTPGNSVA